MSVSGRHAMKARGNRPNAARRRPAAQLSQWKVGGDILGYCVFTVDGDVRDPQVVVLRRVARINGVELGRSIVGGCRTLIALVWLIGSGRGNKGNPAL